MKEFEMKDINIANDIIPVGDFKNKVSKYLKELKTTGRPMVITQKGKPAGVLVSPEDYDELMYQKSVIESIHRGVSDIERGDTYTTKELKAELDNKRA